MRIECISGDIRTVKADMIVVNLFEETARPGGATGAVDAAIGGAISAAIRGGDFDGKARGVLLPAARQGRVFAPRARRGTRQEGEVHPRRGAPGRAAGAEGREEDEAGDRRVRRPRRGHRRAFPGDGRAVLRARRRAVLVRVRPVQGGKGAPRRPVPVRRAGREGAPRGARRACPRASRLGEAINWGRALVATPPADLRPDDLARAARKVGAGLGCPGGRQDPRPGAGRPGSRGPFGRRHPRRGQGEPGASAADRGGVPRRAGGREVDRAGREGGDVRHGRDLPEEVGRDGQDEVRHGRRRRDARRRCAPARPWASAGTWWPWSPPSRTCPPGRRTAPGTSSG